MNTQEHIRSVLGAIRLKNFPLSDLIPLMQKAADELDAKQCKIDQLMLEYCPDEMTQEQFQEWAKHQRLVEEQPRVDEK